MFKKFFDTSKESRDLEDLQRNIALIFVSLTIFSMLFFLITDYLLGLSSDLVQIRIVMIVLLLSCFWYMLRYKKFLGVINLMLGLVLMISYLNYFYNDGFRGPTIFNLFVFVVSVAIFFKRPMNIFWFLTPILGYLVLFFFETNSYFEVKSNYKNLQDLFWDNSFTILICSTFIFLGISFLISNYQKQHLTLVKLKKENELNLEELSKLSHKKSQLIALLSHDLKGPVNSLNSILELVDHGLLKEDDLNLILKNLKNQSFHLTKVLDNTLAWVFAEMDGEELSLVETDIMNLTEEMQKVMQVLAFRKNQTILIELIGQNKQLEIPAKEIKIILKNLLDNAIKFSEEGAAITLHLFSENGKTRWEVRNQAKIISLQDQETLFEFKSKSSKGTKREPGTGIGLSLCKKIADRINYKFGYSTDNQDTNVFFLELQEALQQNNSQTLSTMRANH